MQNIKLPYYLSFDKLLYSTNLYGYEYNFYTAMISNNFILIGHSSKNPKKGNRQKAINKILKSRLIWNKSELKALNLILGEKQLYKITEWILTRILLKLGLILFWKECDTNIKCSIKEISLEKNHLNKPNIKIISNNNTLSNHKSFVSISHSKKEVFVALCNNPIGIDTELIDNHSESWENKIVSELEIINLSYLLKKCCDLSKETILTIIWALKESTLKIQDEISIGSLPEIVISIDNNRIITRAPTNNRIYYNYISFNNDSVLVLTI